MSTVPEMLFPSTRTSPSLPADLPQQAVALAAELLTASRARETADDRQRAAQMARMIDDEQGKKFTIIMTDQILKIEDPRRGAQRLTGLVRRLGVPKFLKAADRLKLRFGSWLARLGPGLVMPLINRQIRQQSSHVIISAEPAAFDRYFQGRVAEGFRINFNQLGEAVLGDHEAERRLQFYLDKLRDSQVTYVSVKLSSVVSQISLTGYRATLETLKERLRKIYRAALENRLGTQKFVNLDMEEYRDLHLTVDVFRQVLDEPEFRGLAAGIVLQAYLPDSFQVQQQLTAWANERVAGGGAPIKIRLVKGANLAMEQVEAAMRGWPKAPYHSKLDVDANFKRMLEFGTRPEHVRVARLGVASHNLFDIAYALLMRQLRGVGEHVEFEMLEGMANGQALEVSARTEGVVLYTPCVLDHEFEAAVAYLVRRLDENTAPGSFLGALFGLEVGSPQWQKQSEAFIAACQRAHDPTLSASPNRSQKRESERSEPDVGTELFRNAPDTDFSIPGNRAWAEEIVRTWSDRPIEPIPLEVAGQKVDRPYSGVGRDPSRPGIELYRYAQATSQDVDRALEAAVAAQPGWEALGIESRSRILRQVAAVFARQRGVTVGAMMVDAGKAITEGDVEVSEAIDFANYYSRSLDSEGLFDGTEIRARGVVVVTPPWNFPYAIPAGGCLAALMAGNAVILKPSRESVLTAFVLAQQLWEGGVPREVLQFLPVGDRAAGKELITDPRTAAVILTGSFDTARNFQSWRPELPLFAETSGKNSMIITASADLDLAVKDLVRGAFGHSGQKCSATSLALVERGVYENPKFRQQLKDAAASLLVGGSIDPSAVATPVIREPDDNLRRGLTSLDDGEEWLLEPRVVDGNPCLWSPGIKLGVKPGSWYHRTECFGPVLGLICVENFEEALQIQNSNAFGLTGGLQSLDPDEIETWRNRVEVGNAYINRSTTGAIVQRQPFGGWKDSCVGPGAKAGGPNYVATLGRWSQLELPQQRLRLSGPLAALVLELEGWLAQPADRTALRAAAESYHYWWENHFGIEHDPSQVHGETNHFRYRSRPWHLLRLGRIEDSGPAENAAMLQVALSYLACRTSGSDLQLSLPSSSAWQGEFQRISGIRPTIESHTDLVARLKSMRDGTVRLVQAPPGESLPPTEIGNVFVYHGPGYANGRLELLAYTREQAVSETIHRYGNIVRWASATTS